MGNNFKVNNTDTVFIVNFEHILHPFPVFLLLNLSRLMPAVSLCISRKNIKYPKQKLKITTEFLKNEFIFNNNITLCKNNSSTEYFSNFFLLFASLLTSPWDSSERSIRFLANGTYKTISICNYLKCLIIAKVIFMSSTIWCNHGDISPWCTVENNVIELVTFLLRISSVNVTISAENSGFCHIH